MTLMQEPADVEDNAGAAAAHEAALAKRLIGPCRPKRVPEHLEMASPLLWCHRFNVFSAWGSRTGVRIPKRLIPAGCGATGNAILGSRVKRFDTPQASRHYYFL